jgi:hypothetical protein
MVLNSATAFRKARVTTALKARSLDTGEPIWFPPGSLLWHIEADEEVVRFSEIGGQGVYEVPVLEFDPSTKLLSK